MKMHSAMMSIVVSIPLFLIQGMAGQESQPRVFLQAASHGNVWNARRDQSMEMAKDFQRDCPQVKVTILQSAADYTVLLNHIEVGLLNRDNQLQVANREGDMLTLREKSGLKSGSIASGVKAACNLILSDWKAHGTAPPQPMSPTPSDSYASPLQGSDQPNTQRAEETPTPPRADKRSDVPSVVPKTSAPVSSATSASAMRDGTPQSQDGANSLGLTVANSEQGGAEIMRIEPDSSASAAGLHVGYVIISVDGKRVKTVAELTALLNNRPSRPNVRLGYMFHTNLGWMPGPEKLLTLEVQGK